MQKVDLKKEFKYLYLPPTNSIVEVEVPSFTYLMIDGEGDPNGSHIYSEAVEALFAVSYTAKFMVKRSAQQIDYAVMPLEGLWWAEDMSEFSVEDKSNWKWTMMILQPDFVSAEVLESAIAEVQKKKNLSALQRIRLESLSERRCAQVMHIGPFTEEGPTIARLHQFIDERSQKTGKHHEIYLSDIRKAAPEKWKTILRQPMI